MIFQDAIEVWDKDEKLKYQPGAELLPAYLPPPHKFNKDDHMFLRKCSEEYARQCFAPPRMSSKDLAFTYLVMWLIFITGILAGKYIL